MLPCYARLGLTRYVCFRPVGSIVPRSYRRRHVPDVRVDLFTHHLWANDRLFDAYERLSHADLDAVVNGYGGLRQIVMSRRVHREQHEHED
jgi:hypothetical protein